MELGTQLLEDKESGDYQWMLFIGPVVFSIGYQNLDGVEPD